jgi:surface antigen
MANLETFGQGDLDFMRLTPLIIVLGSTALAGCQSVGSSGAPPVTGSTTPAGAATSTVAPAPAGLPAPAIPTGPALGGVLGGPVGASLTDDDRQAAWQAQVGALDSGQKRSWRGLRACSASSSRAPRRATAAGPIRRRFTSPAGRTGAGASAAGSLTEAGR